ncbi:hypothetical protein OD781_34150, partial [Pseudomonas aeruginosa]|nr:hypothetical protein [Pseudomonas aeruginosa]MCV4153601.1 hypothetical protein [Pseudomonas aeruginosa]
MRLALRPLRRLSLAAGLAALATLGACSILPEAQVLQVYLLPVHNPPASAAAGGGGRRGGRLRWSGSPGPVACRWRPGSAA